MSKALATALNDNKNLDQPGGEDYHSFHVNPVSAAYRRIALYNEWIGKSGVMTNGNPNEDSPAKKKRREVEGFTRAYMATTGISSTVTGALQAASSFLSLHAKNAKQAILETTQQVDAFQAQLEAIQAEAAETALKLDAQKAELAHAIEEFGVSQADLKDAQMLYEDAQDQLETASAQLERQETLYQKEHARLILDNNGAIVFKGSGNWLNRYYVEDENGARQPLGFTGQVKTLALDFCFRTTGDELLEREKEIRRAENRVDHYDQSCVEAHELWADASEEHAEHKAQVDGLRNFVARTRGELDTTLSKIQENSTNVAQLKERLLVLNQRFVALSRLQTKLKDPATQRQIADGSLQIEDLAKELPPSLRGAFMKEQETLACTANAGTSVAKELDANGVKAPSNDLSIAFKQTIEEKIVPAAKKFFDMVAKPFTQDPPVIAMTAPAPK